jgi:hypothetical protein
MRPVLFPGALLLLFLRTAGGQTLSVEAEAAAEAEAALYGTIITDSGTPRSCTVSLWNSSRRRGRMIDNSATDYW